MFGHETQPTSGALLGGKSALLFRIESGEGRIVAHWLRMRIRSAIPLGLCERSGHPPNEEKNRYRENPISQPNQLILREREVDRHDNFSNSFERELSVMLVTSGPTLGQCLSP